MNPVAYFAELFLSLFSSPHTDMLIGVSVFLGIFATFAICVVFSLSVIKIYCLVTGKKILDID